MRIRPFTPEDLEGCLGLLESNTPEHFVPGDDTLLSEFLSKTRGHYYVVEEDGRIVACGGMEQEPPPEEDVATLCWGIVHADAQRQGIGRALTEHRLQQFLPGHPQVRRVRVNTTQKVQGFYERLGFKVVEVKRDHYAEGLDHVRLERTLERAATASLDAPPGRK